MAFTFSIKDSYRASVEAASGGKNTVIRDDKGNPGVYVFLPKLYMNDLITGAPHQLMPYCFVNGQEVKEVWISKYQNVVVDGRAYSLPFRDPATYVNFDQALQYCYAKGDGHHLMSNAEFAAISLYCKKNNFMPRGNNNFGCDTGASYEKGKETYFDTGANKTGRIATGSGPCSWSHDGTPDGIYDLNGNVWEWNSGLRLSGGEIQVIKDNDVVNNGANHASDSPLWQAILQDGSLVAPGTASSLKIDNTTAGSSVQDGNDVGGDPVINTSIVNKMYTGGEVNDNYRYSNCNFESLAASGGVTVPNLLKALGISPIDAQCGGDGFLARNYGERLPFRGGDGYSSSSAGVFALYLGYARSNSYGSIGFRSAYCVL